MGFNRYNQWADLMSFAIFARRPQGDAYDVYQK